MPLCPAQVRRLTTPDGGVREYRWVHELSYVDDAGRTHTFNAIQCLQTEADRRRTFAWLTDWRDAGQRHRDCRTRRTKPLDD